MRRIIKGKEPKSLETHRNQSFANYDNLPKDTKEELRQFLLKEQFFLCAYCNNRINEAEMKIEHVKSQSQHTQNGLKYSNLLACCTGGEGKKEDFQHCDTKKGDKEISFNPADNDVNVEHFIKFDSSGKIYSDKEQVDNELNKVLNLNLASLVSARKDAYHRFIEVLKLKLSKEGTYSKEQIFQLIRELENPCNGKMKPFVSFIISRLRRKA
jgi:uncharacterized protein (TIGR02646 family)